MNALRKATEHTRKPHRPKLSGTQLAALDWLAGRDENLTGGYWQVWKTKYKGWSGTYRQLKLRVCRTTIRALEHRGFVDRLELPQRRMVRISEAGRAYLRGLNSGT